MREEREIEFFIFISKKLNEFQKLLTFWISDSNIFAKHHFDVVSTDSTYMWSIFFLFFSLVSSNQLFNGTFIHFLDASVILTFLFDKNMTFLCIKVTVRFDQILPAEQSTDRKKWRKLSVSGKFISLQHNGSW